MPLCTSPDLLLLLVLHVMCQLPCRMHPNPALSVLYVLTECIHTNGYLTAFKVDPHSGSLRELGRVTLSGRSSCYISFDKHAAHAVVTNYWDGLINVVELGPNGAPLRVVQEHQQTRRATWRQVVSREVRLAERRVCVLCVAGNSSSSSRQRAVCSSSQAASPSNDSTQHHHGGVGS